MRCLSTMSIPRPNGRGALDRIPVPCGKCPGCLQNKRLSWAYRLSQELKIAETASFVTLTYSDQEWSENVSKINETSNQSDFVMSLSKIDVQLFLKRLRHFVDKWDYHMSEVSNEPLPHAARVSLRYFLTGEYGDKTNRPHYHLLLFNHPVCSEMELYELLGKTWKHGRSFIGSVTEASIMYVAKYLLKGSVIPPGVEPPFSLMSRRPGIGIEYVKRMSDWHHQDIMRTYVVKPGGEKQNLPRYYKEKIYCENTKIKQKEERQDLLDKSSNQKLYEMFQKGVNPFEQELIVKQDLERKIKLLNKNDKL